MLSEGVIRPSSSLWHAQLLIVKDEANRHKKRLCIEYVALHSIDELAPFVVECDASDVAVSATLNQQGRPVALMSHTLQVSEIKSSILQ